MAGWTPPKSDIGWTPPSNDVPDDDDDSPEAAEANAQVAGGEVLGHMLVGGTASAAAKLGGRIVDALPPVAPGVGNDWRPGAQRKADTWSEAAGGIMAPQSEGGQEAERQIGKGAQAVGRGIAKIPGMDTPAGHTLLETGGELLQDAPIVGTAARLPGMAARLAETAVGRTTSTISDFGGKSVYDEALAQARSAPPKVEPGPVTAEQLRSEPQRLPDRPKPPPTPVDPNALTPAQKAKRDALRAQRGLPPEPATEPATPAAEPAPEPAPAPDGLPPEPATEPATPAAEPAPEPAPAPEPPKPAPAVAPPPVTDEAELAGQAERSAPEQQQRLEAVQQLQKDTGAVMPNIRKSAITGDFREHGTDYQLGELGDETMRPQLDQEQAALKAASNEQLNRAGGSVRGLDNPALDERGTIIDRAMQGIDSWFKTNIRQLYKKADAAAGGKPMTDFSSLHGTLSDHSQFTGVEGHQLHADIQQVAKQFGMMGEDGFWKPTTVETTERFRQWLGEQGENPRVSRAVNRVRDALDDDVARHGGAGIYDKAREMRYKRSQMLEGTKGIEQLMPKKNPDGTIYSRPVPLGKMADHITNMDREQFDHVMNVLHDSGKLGSGELAENSAAAINELRRHMAERLHEAGMKSEDKFWNSRAYHDQLNKYSTKLPALFSPEGIRRFNTIRDAGNALRVNKRYPGAAKQIMQAGGLSAIARDRISHSLEGLALGWLGPTKAVVAEMTGIAPALRSGIDRVLPGANAAQRRAKAVGQRMQPLGQRLQGGKQGGWIGNKPEPSDFAGAEDVTMETPHEHFIDENGDHNFSTASGKSWIKAEPQDNGNLRVRASYTDPAERGQGHGGVLYQKAAEHATSNGGRLESDAIVSADAQRRWAELARNGWEVKRDPNAKPTGNGGLINEGDKPVFSTPGRRQGPSPKSEAEMMRTAGQNPNPETPPGSMGMPERSAPGTPQAGGPREQPMGLRPAFRRQAGAVGNLNPEENSGGLIGKLARGVKRTIKPADETPLRGAPDTDHPNGLARASAASYMKKNSAFTGQPLEDYRYVAPEHAQEVADAYDKMKHAPNNPKVKAAYDNFKQETLDQYNHMVKTTGVKVDLDKNYPYKVPREVQDDVRNNNHMSIYPTEEGFGAEGGAAGSDHPMMEMSSAKDANGKPMTYNDLFRAVHDYYGHIAEGNGFRAQGEYNAWRAHREMYSPAARGAMDSETLGQNSWVNAQRENLGASQTATKYADQKAGLLPKAVVEKAAKGLSPEESTKSPQYKEVAQHLTQEEREDMENRAPHHRATAINNMLDAWHSSTSVLGNAAMALAGKAKKGWYEQSAKYINHVFGPDAPRFTALLAAMSPQTSVEMNFHNALRTFVNWDKAGRPKSADAIKKIMEDSSLKNPESESDSNVMEAWHQNGVRALTSANPEHESFQLSGPKVNSFYQNLRDNAHEVTNDSWNAIATNVDQGLFSGAYRKVANDIFGKMGFKSPEYMGVSAKVRAAATHLSRVTGEAWTPREVQETMWSFVKTAFEHAKATGKSIPELLKSGELNDDLIRGTTDFASLFNSPEHIGFLDDSKFGPAARQLAERKGESPKPASPSKASAAAEEALRPTLVSEGERLEGMRQARLANRKARVGNIKVPF